MRRCYLDLNKWVDLARADLGRPEGDPFKNVLAVVQASVALGECSYPLSLGHLLEVWKKRKASQRRPLAATMTKISLHHALASSTRLLPAELDQALHRRFGRPLVPATPRPYGMGIPHITGDNDLHLAPETAQRFLAAHPAMSKRDLDFTVDAALIAGPPEDLPVPGLQMPLMDFADEFRDDEIAQAERWRLHDSPQEERRRGTTARWAIFILDQINAALERAGPIPNSLEDADAMTEFLLDLPSQAAIVELMWLQTDNPQTRWHRNDLHDLVWLSLAVAYCDIVVTERKWAHLLNRTGVPERFNTVVLSDVRDLIGLLA